MKDIVKRLIDHLEEGVTQSDRFHLRNDAAAEIVKLRKKNQAHRKALRQLNKAHEVLWKVIAIRITDATSQKRS